ncbi:hypothetical protein [Afipia felis]|uniref:Uncharacterized protein n=2 Tax=Afipia felis TaxID=1035 RepID=A0A380WAM6_AFIFE|nr:hypothetical protein [Afipia felis]EKS29251.1 hypothetical protein HMPREF9697_01779 [Afipia felis ATCC 53690]SUU77959.1 Uncharacterised protein [Afipia felis]SUU86024.1 Uncharacterised protein [Afipia felis]
MSEIIAEQTIAWLRDLASKGGKGVVNNIDARCLARIADEITRLTELNNKLTEDFNTLARDRVQWQDLAKGYSDLWRKTAGKFCEAQDALAGLRSALDSGPPTSTQVEASETSLHSSDIAAAA